MLQINQISCPIEADITRLEPYIAKKCGIHADEIQSYSVIRQSLDSRHEVRYKYSVIIKVKTTLEKKLLRKLNPDILSANLPKKITYTSENKTIRPIVVGFGPCGMLAALALAEAGCKPIILERGKAIEERVSDVEEFWKTGQLNESSNVQFGEGGAGTFSDGKLTTRVKDDRIHYILKKFVENGADPAIQYQQHPHIGTDKLREIVKNIRLKCMELGAEIHFESTVQEIIIQEGKVTGVKTEEATYLSPAVLLAIGHSATDTFSSLHNQGIFMQSKDFAVGVRIEHPQKWVNQTQYKKMNSTHLPSAEYRLSHTCENGRGVYTFCMCPGGEVVAASSQNGQLVINGMSQSARDGINANSALLVQVQRKDYGPELFDGLHYLEELEKKAFHLGGGNFKAPVQWANELVGKEEHFELTTSYPLNPTFVDFHELFSSEILTSLQEGILAFDEKMPGFSKGLLIGVESRSTCPIRITRNENFESMNTEGLFPAGEGAGYAGGIISSALDGLRCAEAILKKINS